MEPPEGNIVGLTAGIDAGKEEPTASGYTRGAVHMYGVIGIERPMDGSLELHIVMSVDPCGWLPSSVVQLTNEEQGEKAKLIADLVAGASAKRRGGA